MKKEEIKQTKVEFDSTEIETFKSAVKKVNEETAKIGLKKTIDFTPDEITLLQDIQKKLLE